MIDQGHSRLTGIWMDLLLGIDVAPGPFVTVSVKCGSPLEMIRVGHGSHY
jgi:hypothetical protein